MRRGTLRIYLGAAPGVGKTFAMLSEGRRRRERGTDVVVGFVETHGREKTAEQIGDLEVVPRRKMEYRGAAFEEMDLDAILARRPEVALVDELAHTNVPGSRHEKRWSDIDDLLEAGITVISTLNIQHLESLNDVVEQITRVPQRETVPDELVRRADQIEIVDMAPEAIRRRMAHGNIYPAERIDAALANYFRPGNLGALRELALLWVADRVDDALQEYRERHGIARPWETRERIVVALTGSLDGERLIRRGARMTARTRGDLVGVHVRSQDGLAGPSADQLERQRELVEELGGTYREVVGADAGEALVDAARSLNATQIILGATRRSRWAELTRGSVINRVIRDSGAGIDVHVMSHEAPLNGSRPQGRRLPASLTRRRQLYGLALAVLAAPVLAVLLAQFRGDISLASVLLLFLLLVVAVSAVGGVRPALVAAIGSFLLVNWYFTPPLYTFTIGDRENVLALVVFVAVAGITSAFVELAARRAALGARARAEAEAFARLAGSSSVPTLLESLRRIFGLDAATLLHRDRDGWRVEATAGGPVAAEPGDGAVTLEVGQGHLLALAGGMLARDDDRVVNAFVTELAAAIEHQELQAEASEAGVLTTANELRTAILSAVSHDLRTPLAGIKASVTSLLQRDITWEPDAARDFLVTIDEETDRLNALVGNLLDMSRVQTGALQIRLEPIGLDEVVPAALASLGARATRVEAEIAETLPRVNADAGLLERALANVIDNAVAASPPDAPVRVDAGVVGDRVDIRIVDRGSGISADERERIFLPFQRLGDSSNGAGVGLGLAVAKGFVEAMGGEVEVEDTPGGGLTMVLRLRTAS
jgi:two-component system, OmpR family, sensor histidine kinase KdpD